MSFEDNKELQLREVELEYKALCKDHPKEKLWQGHILKRIKILKKEVKKNE